MIWKLFDEEEFLETFLCWHCHDNMAMSVATTHFEYLGNYLDLPIAILHCAVFQHKWVFHFLTLYYPLVLFWHPCLFPLFQNGLCSESERPKKNRVHWKFLIFILSFLHWFRTYLISHASPTSIRGNAHCHLVKI